jgi:alkaline phosphatase D
MARQHSRRQFLIHSTLASSGAIAANLLPNARFIHSAPAIVPLDKLRPRIPYGIATGDITQGSAV